MLWFVFGDPIPFPSPKNVSDSLRYLEDTDAGQLATEEELQLATEEEVAEILADEENVKE